MQAPTGASGGLAAAEHAPRANQRQDYANHGYDTVEVGEDLGLEGEMEYDAEHDDDNAYNHQSHGETPGHV